MSETDTLRILSRRGPLQWLDADRNGVNAYEFYADDLVISAGDDKRVRIWNWNTGEEERLLWAESHFDVRCLRVSHNRELLASGHGAWGGIHLWSLRSGELLWSADNYMYINDVAFSQDDRQVMLLDGADHVMSFDVETGALVNEVGDRDRSGMSRLSSDGDYACCLDNDTIRSFDCRDGRERWSVPVSGKFDMTISADDSMLAVLDSENRIRILRCADGALGPTIVPDPGRQNEYDNMVLAFTPDGTRIACAYGRKYLSVWYTADGRLSVDHMLSDELNSRCFKFLPDGRRFVLGDRRGNNLLGEYRPVAAGTDVTIRWTEPESTEFDCLVREFGLEKSAGYWTGRLFTQRVDEADLNVLVHYANILIDSDRLRGGTPIDLLDKILARLQRSYPDSPVVIDIAIEMLRLGSLSAGAALHDSWGMLVSFVEKASAVLAAVDLSSLNHAQLKKLVDGYRQALKFSLELSLDVDIKRLGGVLMAFLHDADKGAYDELLPYYEEYDSESET